VQFGEAAPHTATVPFSVQLRWGAPAAAGLYPAMHAPVAVVPTTVSSQLANAKLAWLGHRSGVQNPSSGSQWPVTSQVATMPCPPKPARHVPEADVPARVRLNWALPKLACSGQKSSARARAAPSGGSGVLG